jgi:membrane protein YdbS with pleckstrin-like domain
MFENLNNEVKKSLPLSHLLMKIGMAFFLGCALFFLVVWAGVWLEMEWLRYGGMALFALSFVICLGCYLSLVPILVFYLLKKRGE